MNILRLSWRGFCRRRKTSFAVALMVALICCALVACNIVLQVCELCRIRYENPYSDYYRLVVDRRAPQSGNAGFGSYDLMYCGWWSFIEDIHAYFLNVVDYTAEVTGSTVSDLETVSYEWMGDHGQRYILLYGMIDSRELATFARGELLLIDGRYLTRQDHERGDAVCMISEELAQLNDVRIGDVVQIQMQDESDAPFTVVGIYRDTMWRDHSTTTLSYNMQCNRIYVPLCTFEHARAVDCYNYQILVDDESLIPQIEQKVNEYRMTMGHPACFIKVSDIYEGNNSGARTLMMLIAGIRISFSAVALLLMFLFLHSTIRARRREIGTLQALGQSRWLIAVQVVLENLFACSLGMAACAVISSLCGERVAVWVLQRATDNTSVDALRNTGSDMLTFIQNELQSMQGMIGREMICSCIGTALQIVGVLLLTTLLISCADVMRGRLIKLLRAVEDV